MLHFDPDPEPTEEVIFIEVPEGMDEVEEYYFLMEAAASYMGDEMGCNDPGNIDPGCDG